MQRNGKLPHPTTTILELPASQAPAANDQLPQASKQLQGVNVPAQGANDQLQGVNDQLQGVNDQLQGVNAPVQGANAQLHGVNAPVQGINAEPQAEEHPTRPSKESINVYRSTDPIERRLMAARMTIRTLLGDAKLQELLAPYGYNLERLLQGQALFQQAQLLVQQQRARKGDLFAATDARAAAHAQAHATYTRHVALARIALRHDRGAAQKLDLAERKRALAGWVFQAEQFYANALADQAILARLASSGVSYGQLTAAQAQVAAVAAGIVTQQTSKHTAQEAKQARDAAVRALNHWMQDFRAMARIALADQPQRLAQLGLARG